jgi:hypothetical protein
MPIDPTPSFPSKSTYHNYYGYSATWAAGGGVPGVGGPITPTPNGGDLFYNTNDNLMYYFDAFAGVWTGIAPVTSVGLDKRESLVIVGNTGTSGGPADTLNNSDFLGDILGPPPVSVPVGQYGFQGAILSVSGRTRGTRIYVREGNYVFSNGGSIPATWGAFVHLSKMISAATGPITIEAANQNATFIINSTGVAKPTFIFDHPGTNVTWKAGGGAYDAPWVGTTPVTLKNFGVRGNGLAGSGVAKGVATVEIGQNSYSASIPVTPNSIADNVTFEHITINGYNAVALTYDAAAVFVNDIVGMIPTSPKNLTFTDCIFKNAGNASCPVPPPNVGVFTDGDPATGMMGSRNAVFTRCQFNNDGVNGAFASLAGIALNFTQDVKFNDCMAKLNCASGFRGDMVMNAVFAGCSAIDNCKMIPGPGSDAGFYMTVSSYLRFSDCFAQFNFRAIVGGVEYILDNCGPAVDLTACQALGSGLSDGINQNGFVVNLGSNITFNSCEANGITNDGATPTSGYGFILKPGAQTVQINDCQAHNNCNWGVLVDGAFAIGGYNMNDQIVGGTFTNNGRIAGGIRTPGAISRVFSNNTLNQANVLIDDGAGPTRFATDSTEAVHFYYN